MKKQATGVYLLKDNKILFLVRNKKDDTIHQQNVYLPIGGKVETGESIEGCALREVKEESGVSINKLDLRGITYIRGQSTGENDWINFVFTSSDFTGTPKKGNEGYFEWVDINKINVYNLYEGDKIYLDYMFRYQFFTIDLRYKGFKLIDYTVLKAIK